MEVDDLIFEKTIGGEMTETQKKVLAYLNLFALGKESAIHSLKLAGLTGIEERKVRDIIRDLRRMGHPIGSGAQGFWFISDPQEHRATMANLKSRAFDMLRTVSIQERIPAAELAGQLRVALEG